MRIYVFIYRVLSRSSPYSFNGNLVADGDIDKVRGDESLEDVFMEVLESHEE